MKLHTIFLLLISIGCSANIEPEKQTYNVASEEKLNLTNDEEIDVQVNTTIEIEAISDCGRMDCFKAKFAKCEPATVTFTVLDNLVYRYEILGKKGDLCAVKSKFLANPNPKWMDKEMICEYNSSEEFDTAVKNMKKCKGELYDLMISGEI